MQYCINLGNGRRVTIGAYVRAWKQAKTLPPDTYVKTVPGQWHGGTVADVLRELRYGMHDRINRHDSAYGKGRKWHHDWQRQAIQTANSVNSRCVVHYIPKEFRDRLGHRIADCYD